MNGDTREPETEGAPRKAALEHEREAKEFLELLIATSRELEGPGMPMEFLMILILAGGLFGPLDPSARSALVGYVRSIRSSGGLRK